MEENLLENFKTLPFDLKRTILQKYQIITRRENIRKVKCKQWMNSINFNHAMFQCDDIICLVRAECIECGIEKTRGLGLRYGIEISQNEIKIVSPTSKAYTASECLRIIRSLCNILHYASRINKLHVDLPLISLIKTKITTMDDVSLLIPPKYHCDKNLVSQIKKIIKSILDHKNIKLWD